MQNAIHSINDTFRCLVDTLAVDFFLLLNCKYFFF